MCSRVSAASIWEVAVKHAIGKLRTESLLDLTGEAGLEIPAITGEHA